MSSNTSEPEKKNVQENAPGTVESVDSGEKKAPADFGKTAAADGAAKPTQAAAEAKAKPAAKKPASKPAAKKPAKKKTDDEESGQLTAVKGVHRESVSDEVVIRFDNVTKTYNLYRNDQGRFLGIFNYKKKGVFLGSVDASKNLSFEIKKGEAVAFIGRNGAGKSTALKMITGVTHPTSGKVTVKGRVSALLELTAGFDMQLTGRENISLRGQIMGLTRAQAKELEPAIIEFAELGLYIDQPMRTYSSGMKARLGFAFAVATNPDILVVDEALSVGDRVFKRKCINRIREIMMDKYVTVLFVTHNSKMAKEFCSRGIVLDEGHLLFDGTIEDAIEYYDDLY